MTTTWLKTRRRHLAVIQSVQDPPKNLHITANRKTGFSVDFPPHVTCNPTQVCMGGKGRTAGCYALSGFMSYPAAVRQHALNQRLVDALIEAPYAEVVRVTDALWSELPRGQDWLRWNGAGDLTPGACRVINCFTRRHADIALWVITRKPLEVARLKDRKSLRLLLSLDHSTPKAIANELRLATTRFKRGVARLAYTRVDEDDVPPSDVWVVFNKHVGGRRYDWNDTTGTTCHATLPGVTHEGACDPCRRCFLPRSINP